MDSTIYPMPDYHVDLDSSDYNNYSYISIRTEVTDLFINKERLEKSQIFANIGTWDWNIKTNEIYWSERIGYLFGYNDKIPSTKYQAFIDCIHPEDRKIVTSAIQRCIDGVDEYNIEHRVVWPSGEIRWMLERGDVIRNSDNTPIKMLGVVQDITDKKNTELKLEKAVNDADSANKAKSAFLASMSHELRTPMNAIIGFAQLLQMNTDRPLNNYEFENIMEILSAGQHLLHLIDEVLNLSEIESGKINLDIHSINLAESISESITLVYPAQSKMKVNLEIFVNGNKVNVQDIKSASIFVKADKFRIKQVLLNLMSNACKYNKIGGTLTLSINQGKDDIVVCVKDTGKGINSEGKKKLFTPFNRLGFEQTDIEGTGIGLVITKELIELMGGDISFDSIEGKGSSFWFSIPLDKHQSGIKSMGENFIGNSNDLDLIENTNNLCKTILYIEDNPANLRLIAQLVGRLNNVNLLSTHTAELGLKAALKCEPDLILLDINLPGMSGIDALSNFKGIPKFTNTPILAISANAMPEEIQRALDAGFDEYITKPVDIAHLMVMMNNYLH